MSERHSWRWLRPARLSLARTAKLLADAGAGEWASLAPPGPDDLMDEVEATGWGPAHRLRPPARIEGAPAVWTIPARPLGWAEPSWA